MKIRKISRRPSRSPKYQNLLLLLWRHFTLLLCRGRLRNVQRVLLFLPTRICFLMGGERVTCHGSKFTKGPDALGKFLFILRKKSVINSLRQVRPVIFRSTKFCQGLPNFKDAVVLPRSRTNFCQAWNLTDLSIYTPWFEGKCQSIKFDLYF